MQPFVGKSSPDTKPVVGFLFHHLQGFSYSHGLRGRCSWRRHWRVNSRRALLAQRGVDVCLLERGPQVGGCAASFEKFGYRFEQGYGLFTGWEPDGIQQRVFSELPVDPPRSVDWSRAM